MKVAISSKGSDLEAQVDPRFGRCRYFIIVDPATKAFEVLDNEAAAISGGAGIQAAQIVANAGVDAVVTGSVGPNATDVLAAAGVKTYLGASGTVREALQQLWGRAQGCSPGWLGGSIKIPSRTAALMSGIQSRSRTTTLCAPRISPR